MPDTTTQEVDVQSFQSPLFLQLSLERFGNSRKGDLEEIETEADKTMLKLSKSLLDCEEFEEVRAFDSETVGKIRGWSVPSMFKNGIYMVRAKVVRRIADYLEDRSSTRQELLKCLGSSYDAAVEEAKRRLGPQFDARNYPAKDDFLKSFKMTWRFFMVSAPDKAKGIDPEFVEQERDRLAKLIQAATEEGLALVRTQFADLVDHMLDRLTPDADGTRKRFHASAIENVKGFIEAFEMRNVANDRPLEQLVEQARALLAGIDPEKIRKSNGAKDDLRAAFDGLKKKLDAFVTKSPKRFVDVNLLGGEEAEAPAGAPGRMIGRAPAKEVEDAVEKAGGIVGLMDSPAPAALDEV